MGLDDSAGVCRPPSLREVLDAGCDLEGMSVSLITVLAEAAFTEVPFMAAGARAHRAAANRAHVDELLSSYGGPLGRALRRGEDPASAEEAQRLATLWSWEADLFDDPALAERFRQALPEPFAAKYRRQFDQARRPHPIEVRVPAGHWHCSSCGAAYDQGEAHAITITDREGFSDLDYPINYCLDCIVIAAQVAEYARTWRP